MMEVQLKRTYPSLFDDTHTTTQTKIIEIIATANNHEQKLAFIKRLDSNIKSNIKQLL